MDINLIEMRYLLGLFCCCLKIYLFIYLFIHLLGFLRMYCSFFKDKKLHDPYERHETHNTLSSFITSYKKNPFPIKIKAVIALNGSSLTFIVQWNGGTKRQQRLQILILLFKSYLNGLQFIVGSSVKMKIIFFLSKSIFDWTLTVYE